MVDANTRPVCYTMDSSHGATICVTHSDVTATTMNSMGERKRDDIVRGLLFRELSAHLAD